MREKLDKFHAILDTYRADKLMGVDFWHGLDFPDETKIRDRYYGGGKNIPEFAVRIMEACEMASKLKKDPLEIYEKAVRHLFFVAYLLKKQEYIANATAWASFWGLGSAPGAIERIAKEAREIAIAKSQQPQIAPQPNPQPQVVAQPTAIAQPATRSIPVVGDTRVSVPEAIEEPRKTKPPTESTDLVPKKPAAVKLHAEEVHDSPISASENPLIQKGKTIARVITKLLPKSLGVEFVQAKPKDMIRLRHTVYTLKMQEGTKFSQVEGFLPEALSAAGEKPGAVFTEWMPYNQIDIYIPRPSSEWGFVNFIEFFIRDSNLGLPTKDLQTWFSALNENAAATPSESARRQLKDVVIAIHEKFKYSPYTDLSKPFRLPIGVSMKGEPILATLDAGAFIIGNPGGGKSNLLKTMMVMGMLLFHPSKNRADILDAEDSAFRSFVKFENDPSAVNPWVNSAILGVNPKKSFLDPPSRYQETDKNAAEEKRNREAAFEDDHPLNRRFMEIFQAYEKRMSRLGRHEKLTDYNFQHPEDQMHIAPIFLDGVYAMKRDWSKDLADHWLGNGAMLFRKAGKPLIVGSQYSSWNYSVPPAIRECLDVTIAFKTSEDGAKLAFSEAAAAKMVSRLCGKGDFIIQRREADERYDHAQGLFAPGVLIEEVRDILCEHYASARIGQSGSLERIFSQ